MTITTFNPFIDTAHADELIRLFEELGFERRHKNQALKLPTEKIPFSG